MTKEQWDHIIERLYAIENRLRKLEPPIDEPVPFKKCWTTLCKNQAPKDHRKCWNCRKGIYPEDSDLLKQIKRMK